MLGVGVATVLGVGVATVLGVGVATVLGVGVATVLGVGVATVRGVGPVWPTPLEVGVLLTAATPVFHVIACREEDLLDLAPFLSENSRLGK